MIVQFFGHLCRAILSFVLYCLPWAGRSQWWTYEGVHLRWEKLPISVEIHESLFPEAPDIIVDAIERINRAVGATVFSPLISITKHDTHQIGKVTIVSWDKETHGLCSIKMTRDHRIRSALITSYNYPHRQIIIHELLHAIGLLHTESLFCPLSVMCSKIGPYPRILPGDIGQIREIYEIASPKK